jgi:hypothetical protein
LSGDLHALLIGVDCYLPNKLSDGSSYASLNGSVRDVERVQSYLHLESGHPPKNVVKLTSSRGPGERPTEPPESWPTYDNMIAAFRTITEGASAGDQVYIHYSGHGGRTTTSFPELKGADGYDESLVPCDIGDPSSRYLLGPEVSLLLKQMADKGLVVSVVFDCCHSGGASRGQGEAAQRGLGIVDRRDRAPESFVGSRDELLALLRPATATGPVTRSVTMEGWLPDPRGYVLLAACRPQEFAFEYPFDGKESQGALTYWLLDTLRRGGTGVTYKQLHERILAKVHDQFWSQTPMLMGEMDRVFFGAERVAARNAVTVMSVDGNRMKLDVGQAHGIRPGMRFTIHPSALDAGRAGERLALVEIRELGAVDSMAEIVEATRTMIEPGAQAVPFGLSAAPGVLRLQSAVRVAADAKGASPADLERVRSAIAAESSGFIRLAAEGEKVDFQVAVDERGGLEILDEGGIPVPNVPRSLPGQADEIVRRLVHLTRYHNVLQLANEDEESPLAGKLELVMVGTQRDFIKGDKPNPRPLAGTSPYEIETGEWLFMKIANRSSQPLNVVALDLSPDWGVAQVSPGKMGPAFWTLDPGAERPVQIRCSLPQGCDQGTDVVKVIATLGAANFRWLELPAFGVQDPAGDKRGTPKSPLEQLFARLSVVAPTTATRNLEVAEYASEQWTTARVELRVKRVPLQTQIGLYL